MKTLKLDNWGDIPENYTGIVEYKNGIIVYYLNGKRHREDGPAFIWGDGTVFYYLNGSLHREDGPAIIWDDGRMEYFIIDKKVTEEFICWLKEKNSPLYEKWDKDTKLIFK